MPTYKRTIVRDNPAYKNRRLLLTDREKERLYQTVNGSHIEVRVDEDGRLFVKEIASGWQRKEREISLRRVGEEYLSLKDPSVPQMLKHLVIPEMEVERIFNCLRYKYLVSIYKSGFRNPARLMHYSYNKAFQTFAGMHLYQGNTKERKNNNHFWKSAGFKSSVRKEMDFDIEREEMRFILLYIRKLGLGDFGNIYAELIAIKPGFHEAWTHHDFFDGEPGGDDPRTTVLRLLRGDGDIDELKPTKTLERQINGNNYLSFASCNVTEGPFVFRKKISNTYFDEIREIRSSNNLKQLKNKFWVFDYHKGAIHSREGLAQILPTLEKFRGFM